MWAALLLAILINQADASLEAAPGMCVNMMLGRESGAQTELLLKLYLFSRFFTFDEIYQTGAPELLTSLRALARQNNLGSSDAELKQLLSDVITIYPVKIPEITAFRLKLGW